MGEGEKRGAQLPNFPISQSPNYLIAWATRWHVAFLALLALLALHAFSTMGVYVVSDDLAWVQRAAADAHRPWNAFVQPLFGDYYRPIPELIWTLNYRLWGFDFDGHQLMFILMWLAGVCAVYAVGCRLGGRIAGFAAAMLIGLNDVYLVLSSWKSWYTTLTEYVAVLACVWALLRWLEERRPRHAIAAAALAAVAVLSRELAPLVLSTVALFILVLPGFKKPGPGQRWHAVSWLIVWAVVTGGVLFALPSYRSSVAKLLKSEPAPASAATGAQTSRAAYVWTRFVSHTRGIFGLSTLDQMFGWGLSLVPGLVRDAAGGASCKAEATRICPTISLCPARSVPARYNRAGGARDGQCDGREGAGLPQEDGALGDRRDGREGPGLFQGDGQEGAGVRRGGSGAGDRGGPHPALLRGRVRRRRAGPDAGRVVRGELRAGAVPGTHVRTLIICSR